MTFREFCRYMSHASKGEWARLVFIVAVILLAFGTLAYVVILEYK